MGTVAAKRETEAPFFIGIDIGTQRISGVLTGVSGAVLASHHRNLVIQSSAPGYAEHDPERDWWHNACAIIRGLLDESGVKSHKVVAVGVAGLFPVTCTLDKKGKPVTPAILYSDSRAAREVNETAQTLGRPLKGDEPVPNLQWLRRHRPNAMQRTRMVLSATGYLVYRLSGQQVIDPHNAYRFGGIADDSHLSWDRQQVEKLDLPPSIFPDIANSLEVVGSLSANAARATGLSTDTKVIAGTTDTVATLIGNGVLNAGDAMIYYGTTGLLTLVTVALSDSLAQPELLGPDVPYDLAVYLPGSGAALHWALDLLTSVSEAPASRSTLFAQLDRAAARIDPGADGILFFPYLSGRLYPQPDSLARGHFAGLTLQHNVAHLWRSLLEAPGYVIADRMLQPLPVEVSRLVATGGGARSATWRQIISDMLGLPQHIATGGSGVLGAAFLAAVGTGYFSDLSAIHGWLGPVEVTEPDLQRTAKYRQILTQWQQLDALLATYSRPRSRVSRENN